VFGRKKAEEAAELAQEARAEWSERRAALAEWIEMAQTYEGDATADGIILKPGETVFASASDCSLIEDRKGAGHWEGRTSGFSIPIGAGVRYRVGQTKGHYIQGSPIATAIDTGSVYVTDRRVVFAGSKQTRECLFDKLVALSRDDTAGNTTLSVSNRQKPTVIHYGPKLAGWFGFRLELALAHHRGNVPALVDHLRQTLASLEANPPSALQNPG
jgi:hypothetical protein